MIQILPRSFYMQTTQEVARALLGKEIRRTLPSGEILAGIIVETEAYLGSEDPASHAFRGKTPRNAVMFGEGGHAYIYFTYGMHMMLNLVTGPEGVAQAVLIRALEPTDGISLMRGLRKDIESQMQLTNGPGKLAQALYLTRQADDGVDVTSASSYLQVIEGLIPVTDIVSSTRIGISRAKEFIWRYYIKGNPYVSKK
jgi:DNA-3-methyladenine glycosylase